MKKFLTVFLTFCVIVFSLSTFVGCNSTKSEDSVDLNDNIVKASDLNIVTTKSVVQKNENYKNTVTSFYDDNFNYWVYDLGLIVDVPLDDTYSYIKYGGGNVKREFTTMKSYSSNIKTISERTVTKVTTWSDSHSVNIGFNIEFGIKKLANVNISAGYNYTHTSGASNSDTWSNTFEKCESYSESEAKTITISFDDSCQKGYYRYIYIGVVKVYAVIAQDRTTKQFYNDTYTEIKAYGFCLDYNADTPVFETYDNRKLDFDLSLVENLPEPTVKLPTENNKPIVVHPESLTVFNKTIRTGTTKINGSGHYTLDIFTLDKTIKELIDFGYTYLDICISYDLKEEDNCKQYISLYTPTNYKIRSETVEHGGSNRNKSWGTHKLECDVLLNQLDSNTFYFKCQAENAIFKDFYIGTVVVNIKAV